MPIDVVTKENFFFGVCMVIAAYFAVGFIVAAGFPPTSIKDNWHSLAAFGLFFLLPFVTKIDFFQIISVERKLDEVKKETIDAKQKVEEMREDVRYVLNVQQQLNSSMNLIARTSSSANNTTTVVIPPLPPQQVQEVAKERVSNIKVDMIKAEADIRLNDDTLEATATIGTPPEKFVRLQILTMREQIELRVLKLIGVTDNKPVKEINPQWNWFVATAIDEKLEPLTPSFEVFASIANAVAHDGDINRESLDNAIFVGQRLVKALEDAIRRAEEINASAGDEPA